MHRRHVGAGLRGEPDPSRVLRPCNRDQYRIARISGHPQGSIGAFPRRTTRRNITLLRSFVGQARPRSCIIDRADGLARDPTAPQPPGPGFPPDREPDEPSRHPPGARVFRVLKTSFLTCAQRGGGGAAEGRDRGGQPAARKTWRGRFAPSTASRSPSPVKKRGEELLPVAQGSPTPMIGPPPAPWTRTTVSSPSWLGSGKS